MVLPREQIDETVRDAIAARLDENECPIEEHSTIETVTLDFIECTGGIDGVTFPRLCASFNRVLKERGISLPLV